MGCGGPARSAGCSPGSTILQGGRDRPAPRIAALSHTGDDYPAPRAQRTTRTGTLEWSRTLEVTLPNRRLEMPRRPCEDIMMRSHLLRRAVATISWNDWSPETLTVAQRTPLARACFEMASS